mgnify:CR=1 FL=1|jgi:hypothetical protein
MSPWDFLAWAVAVGVSLIVVTLAIVVVIAAVKAFGKAVKGTPSENHPARRAKLRVVE